MQLNPPRCTLKKRSRPVKTTQRFLRNGQTDRVQLTCLFHWFQNEPGKLRESSRQHIARLLASRIPRRRAADKHHPQVREAGTATAKSGYYVEPFRPE
jgi:hypothetical protein